MVGVVEWRLVHVGRVLTRLCCFLSFPFLSFLFFLLLLFLLLGWQVVLQTTGRSWWRDTVGADVKVCAWVCIKPPVLRVPAHTAASCNHRGVIPPLQCFLAPISPLRRVLLCASHVCWHAG